MSKISYDLLTFIKIIKVQYPTITKLELQKILYLIYCDYIAKFNKFPFTDPFEAGYYGPTIRNLDNIRDTNCGNTDVITTVDGYESIVVDYSKEETKFILKKLKNYGENFNILELINKCHHDTCGKSTECGKVMDKKTIFKHHSEIGSDGYKGEEND